MSLIFSVPGKTFLAGEYLALQGGPTLVFLSEPRFELHVQKGHGGLGVIHPESPAGLFVRQYPEIFSQYDLDFVDPYQGRGGFGASTAQFLGVYAFKLKVLNPEINLTAELQWQDLLEAYFAHAWKGEGQRPSGADLVGQYAGQLTVFEKRSESLSALKWPFADLDFYLLHTGNKVATHEHLKNLPAFDASGLLMSFAKIRESLQEKNSSGFVLGITAYASVLKELNFTCPETLSLLGEILNVPNVLTAKGCGALGADVVLVLTSKNNGAALKQYCENKHLSIISSSDQIASGLQVRGTL